MNTGAAILVGGKSVRMGGRNKALLEVEGEPILAKTIAALEPRFDDIMIIGGEPDLYSSFGREWHGDVLPGFGSLGGIHAALSHARQDKVFCIACDMPFIRDAVISLLLERAGEEWEAVVPRLAPGLEPLCTVYDRSLKTLIEKMLARGERRIRSLFDSCRALYIEEEELRLIDPELESFVNINTPRDLERARAGRAGAGL